MAERGVRRRTPHEVRFASILVSRICRGHTSQRSTVSARSLSTWSFSFTAGSPRSVAASSASISSSCCRASCVTNVILGDIDEHGTLRFGWFYARRVRRLLPAAVVASSSSSFTFLLITSVVRRLPLVGDARSALLYFANWHFLGACGDYFAADVDKSPFLHFWSLSIEEQFYFVFPVLLLLLARLSRRSSPAALLGPRRAVRRSRWRASSTGRGMDPNRAYYGTDARLYQLLAGALLACALRVVVPGPPRPARRPAECAAGSGGGPGSRQRPGRVLAHLGVASPRPSAACCSSPG